MPSHLFTYYKSLNGFNEHIAFLYSINQQITLQKY